MNKFMKQLANSIIGYFYKDQYLPFGKMGVVFGNAQGREIPLVRNIDANLRESFKSISEYLEFIKTKEYYESVVDSLDYSEVYSGVVMNPHHFVHYKRVIVKVPFSSRTIQRWTEVKTSSTFGSHIFPDGMLLAHNSSELDRAMEHADNIGSDYFTSGRFQK